MDILWMGVLFYSFGDYENISLIYLGSVIINQEKYLGVHEYYEHRIMNWSKNKYPLEML